MEATENKEEMPLVEKPSEEHGWLQKLVGEWTYETEPDESGQKFTGTETVRSLGGLWAVAEGNGCFPDGTPTITVLTIGYDTAKKAYVGTWIGSMMSKLWVYSSMELNEEKTILSMYGEGPSFSGDGTTCAYKDVIEFVDDNNRSLKGFTQEKDGSWTQFMGTYFRRK